jgi:hypothetical protein
MKIVCIENCDRYNNHLYNLTIGKTYDAIDVDDYIDYLIVNDSDNITFYDTFLFKSPSEYRNMKIDKLLNQ